MVLRVELAHLARSPQPAFLQAPPLCTIFLFQMDHGTFERLVSRREMHIYEFPAVCYGVALLYDNQLFGYSCPLCCNGCGCT